MPYKGRKIDVSITKSTMGFYSVECSELGWCTNGYKYIGDAIKEFELMCEHENQAEHEINWWITACEKLIERCYAEKSTYDKMLKILE